MLQMAASAYSYCSNRVLFASLATDSYFLSRLLTFRIEFNRVANKVYSVLISPPNFVENNRFYLYYTNRSGNTVLSRFIAHGNLADPDSEEILLEFNQPFSNHNGGRIEFGPDGMLYLGLGDGGSGGDPQGNGQKPPDFTRQN